MQVGDVIVRKSYQKDMKFTIVKIINHQAILNGLNYRLIADADLDDLECVESRLLISNKWCKLKNKDSKLLKEVLEVTKDLEDCAGGAGSNLGTGGMITKLQAAKRANNAGVHMVLANGEDPEILNKIIKGDEIGTLFVAKNKID